MSYQYDLCKKVLLLGDQYVGKTSLVERLKSGKFSTEYNATKETNVQRINIDENVFWLWDTSGIINNQYTGINPYIWVDLCIIMFDNTSEFSYSNITQWVIQLKKYSPKAHIIIVKNKIDIHTDLNNYTIQDISISIKTGHGIDKLLNIIETILYPVYAKF